LRVKFNPCTIVGPRLWNVVFVKFRKDINGLRALAVFGVMLYHFKSQLLPGGFAGVDVFFVISGFLMTGIIFSGLVDNKFALINFYFARAKRIIPALLILCSVVLVVGWFFIIPPDYELLAKHVHKSLNFLSNIAYWRESGYFDVDSDQKWLLHTWSLSVEWQFYVLYPLILLAIKRMVNIKVIPKVILISTALGFISCVYVSVNWPNSAFYLLPTRAWEMLLGGIAFLYPKELTDNTKRNVYRLGITMILGSYLLLSSDLVWPGYLSAIPVIGTYLILIANRDNGFITHNPVAQFLGKTSYSTYLWHWPIFVALTYIFGALSFVYILAGLSLSIAIGWLSYTLIEVNGRKNNLFVRGSILLYAGVFILTFTSVSSKYLNNQANFNVPKTVLNSISRAPAACFDDAQILTSNNWLCSLGQKSQQQTDFIVMGDSHMYSQLPAFEKWAGINRKKGEYAGFSGCPPLLGVHPLRSDQKEKNCFELNNRLFNYVQDNNIKTVILSARWTYYTEQGYSNSAKMTYLSLNEYGDKNKEDSFAAFEQGVKQTIKKYNAIGIVPHIILQVPEQKYRPQKLFYGAYLSNVPLASLQNKSVSLEEHLVLQQRVNNIFTQLRESRDYEVTLIDPADTFCHDGRCMVGNKVVSYYFDTDHLSEQGALQFVPQLTDALIF
jgi:peptidoglycan/LPS O-acetylase OafA/YrhL